MNLPAPMPAPAGATSTPAAESGRSISSSPGKALLALSASQPLSQSQLSTQELRDPHDSHPAPFSDPSRRVSPSSHHSIPVPPLETAEETSTVRNENDYCPEGTIFNRLQRQPHFVREADITVMLTREASNRYLDLYCESVRVSADLAWSSCYSSVADAECIYQLWPVPSIIQR